MLIYRMSAYSKVNNVSCYIIDSFEDAQIGTLDTILASVIPPTTHPHHRASPSIPWITIALLREQASRSWVLRSKSSVFVVSVAAKVTRKGDVNVTSGQRLPYAASRAFQLLSGDAPVYNNKLIVSIQSNIILIHDREMLYLLFVTQYTKQRI